jgi:hypothetical protein
MFFAPSTRKILNSSGNKAADAQVRYQTAILWIELWIVLYHLKWFYKDVLKQIKCVYEGLTIITIEDNKSQQNYVHKNIIRLFLKEGGRQNLS